MVFRTVYVLMGCLAQSVDTAFNEIGFRLSSASLELFVNFLDQYAIAQAAVC